MGASLMVLYDLYDPFLPHRGWDKPWELVWWPSSITSMTSMGLTRKVIPNSRHGKKCLPKLALLDFLCLKKANVILCGPLWSSMILYNSHRGWNKPWELDSMVFLFHPLWSSMTPIEDDDVYRGYRGHRGHRGYWFNAGKQPSIKEVEPRKGHKDCHRTCKTTTSEILLM